LFLRQTVVPRLPILRSPAELGLPYEPVEFQATDGTTLAGWKIPIDPNRPWIILCHGLGSNRGNLLDIGAWLATARFNLFLFDFRAHGESTGRVTSFGWLEQRDLEGALAFLGRQPDVADKPYGIYGASMGGVVALTITERDERLRAIAVDSIYENLATSLGRHVQLLYHLPPVPFLWFIQLAYRARFGVWPGRVAPQESLRKLGGRRALVIHGTEDVRMPLSIIDRAVTAAGESAQLLAMQGAAHLQGSAMHPERFSTTLVKFFEASLTSSTPQSTASPR